VFCFVAPVRNAVMWLNGSVLFCRALPASENCSVHYDMVTRNCHQSRIQEAAIFGAECQCQIVNLTALFAFHYMTLQFQGNNVV
jgi:hypothetical protein